MKKILFAAISATCMVSCCHVPVFNLENPVVKAYLDQTDYDVNDYSYTNVDPYCQMRTTFRKDWPSPVTLTWESTVRLDSLVVAVSEKKDLSEPFSVVCSSGATEAVEVWNLIPGRKYYYGIRALKDSTEWFDLQNGSFKTAGRRRMMRVDGVSNVRDLGGLKTEDGRTLRFGKIFRGGQLDGWDDEFVTEEGLKTLRDFMKIGTDIDYRNDWDLCRSDEDTTNDVTWSRLGENVDYYNFQTRGIDGIKKETKFGDIYKVFLQSLRDGKPVYTHCIAGADRTGIMCLLLEASLGVSENDAIMDYELTSFSKHGRRARSPMWCKVPQGVEYIKSLGGATFQDCCRLLLKSQGVTDEEIAEFQGLMLE